MKTALKTFLATLALTGLFLLPSVTATPTVAGPLTEGSIVYTLDMSGIEDPTAAAMMQGAKMTIRFKGQNVRTEFDMGMMKTTVIADGKTNEAMTLMNMMGQKWAIKISPEEMEQQENEKADFTIEYVDETKTIANYKCKKALVKTEDGTDLTLWYTDEIQPANKKTEYFSYDELEGFPLEMEVAMEGMRFTMIAEKVDKASPADNLFLQTVPEGYEVMSMDQLQQMFGGGMGGGGME